MQCLTSTLHESNFISSINILLNTCLPINEGAPSVIQLYQLWKVIPHNLFLLSLYFSKSFVTSSTTFFPVAVLFKWHILKSFSVTSSSSVTGQINITSCAVSVILVLSSSAILQATHCQTFSSSWFSVFWFMCSIRLVVECWERLMFSISILFSGQTSSTKLVKQSFKNSPSLKGFHLDAISSLTLKLTLIDVSVSEAEVLVVPNLVFILVKPRFVFRLIMSLSWQQSLMSLSKYFFMRAKASLHIKQRTLLFLCTTK